MGLLLNCDRFIDDLHLLLLTILHLFVSRCTVCNAYVTVVFVFEPENTKLLNVYLFAT